ncbi:MAG: restriction endonuclease subunit S [Desulfobacterium sp.]|nr:restriction endonuclease subunit S [Desulfobacterium sp.]MBU3948945.1 restriction endonuclease subunit S [Pseudomonadota bacterium]
MTARMGEHTKHTVYGLMSARFESSPLVDLCIADGGVQTGPFGSQLHASDYVDYGTPIITVEHLGDNRIIHNNLPRVTDEDKDRLSRYTLVTGDIVFSRVGSVDRRAVVHPEEDGWLFSGRCLRIRPDKNKIDPGFLSWFFGFPGFQEHIRQIAVGATMPSLNTKILGDVPIYYPSSPTEQQAIACILGALDDKIELNRQMNRTQEETARAIFKSWFVDFDPVRAKTDGQQPPGLKPEIAALFPDTFEDSELGEIPAGWRVRPIGDVVQVLGGGTPSTKEPDYWEGGFHPFCTPKDMSSLTEPVLLGTERHLTDKGLTKVSSGCLPIGTVLLSSRAPIGYLAIAETPVSINQGIIAMVCDGGLPNLYVLYWTRANMERVLANANGSTFLEISKQNFRPISAVIPPPTILRRFMQIVDPQHQRVVLSLRQIQHIAALRDTLLPKLLSGELVVAEAERIVGRVI